MKHRPIKTIITTLLIIASFCIFSFNEPTYSADMCNLGGAGAGLACDGGGSDLGSKAGNAIDTVAGIVQGIAYSLAVLFIIIGGINYITSGGDPGKAEKGKKTIIYACIGLFITVIASTIANMFNSTSPAISDPGFRSMIEGVTNVIFGLATAIAVLFIVIGGINYITSGGDPGKTEKGKKTIIYALIGLVIVSLAWAIANMFFGGTISDPGIRPVIINVANAIIGIAAVIAVLFVVIGGINYLTSAGDPAKTEKGKKTIIYALVGLAICALAFTIVNWFIGTTGL